MRLHVWPSIVAVTLYSRGFSLWVSIVYEGRPGTCWVGHLGVKGKEVKYQSSKGIGILGNPLEEAHGPLRPLKIQDSDVLPKHRPSVLRCRQRLLVEFMQNLITGNNMR